MSCAICNAEIVKMVGPFSFNSKMLGEVVVPGVKYEECRQCGDKTLSPDASEYVSCYVKDQEQAALRNIPAGDLISAGEAAEILGFTKQNFSKSPKIRRGFIYSVIVGGRRFYSRKSTELYRETLDGRFRMNISNDQNNFIFIIASPVESSIENSSYIDSDSSNVDNEWCSTGKSVVSNGVYK